MNNLKIIIAGGSGFVGQAMAARWSHSNEVIVLSRQLGVAGNRYGNNQSAAKVRNVRWDGRTPGDWMQELEGCSLLVNLSGRSVNCRYTEANKADILQSRVQATQVLGEAVRRCAQPPAVWINGASATIYRHATDRPQDEFRGEMHDDFSVQVCKAWETAFNSCDTPGTRKALLRMAIVLGAGGALVPYRRLAKLGLGGAQGNGWQMFSWVHMDDVCRIVEWIWGNERAQGAYNASAPGPVSNREFMKTLRSVLDVPFGLPAPAWLLKAGAALIGTETELLLKSRWVLPARLLQEGYAFCYPELRPALEQLLRQSAKMNLGILNVFL